MNPSGLVLGVRHEAVAPVLAGPPCPVQATGVRSAITGFVGFGLFAFEFAMAAGIAPISFPSYTTRWEVTRGAARIRELRLSNSESMRFRLKS